LAYRGLDRYAEAVEAFKEAIRLEPDNASAHFGLGWAYLGLDRYAEAVEAFKEAIRLEPDNAWAHFGLGEAISHAETLRRVLGSLQRGHPPGAGQCLGAHVGAYRMLTATPRRWKPTKRP
jgi:cytochrome c-type biogenesis protein CcmH/NrfG